jgi:hypothetical protein
MESRVILLCHSVWKVMVVWESRQIRCLADEKASTGVCERVAFLHWIRKEISFSLIRGNARILKRFVGCLAQGVGENVQQGANMPAVDARLVCDNCCENA